jgi:hypothetical protein
MAGNRHFLPASCLPLVCVLTPSESPLVREHNERLYRESRCCVPYTYALRHMFPFSGGSRAPLSLEAVALRTRLPPDDLWLLSSCAA